MTTRIGLDFGTANTVIARWNEARGEADPIPLEGVDVLRDGGSGVRQRTVPSLIAFDQQRRWLGAQVVPELLDAEDTVVFQAAKSAITGRSIDIAALVGDKRITARDAATQFLADITALALLELDARDLEVVATAPVETFDTYRDWLVNEVAADLPGTRLRVVDEATAAAVGYAVRMRAGDLACVVDFGAGTLDVAVVQVEDPHAAGAGAAVRIIAKTGLDLGGNHIDAMLAEHVSKQAKLPLGDQVLRNRIYRRLLASAESAKIALAAGERAVIEATDPVSGRNYSGEVTRAEFERLLRDSDTLGRVNRALRRTLDASAERGHPAERLSAVLLVGGSCLIPAVQDLVRMQFDPGIIRLDRPLEAVAAGAASIAGGQEIHDHIQHDYAIRHYNSQERTYAFETVVPAGTGYPSTEPVAVLTIKAVREGQRDFGLAIYELAHATFRDASADVEIVFDPSGGARTIEVDPQRRQERSLRWLNEQSLTFLKADPPAVAGTGRFRLEFGIDAHKRLTVSAYDIERRTLLLDSHPVVRLS